MATIVGVAAVQRSGVSLGLPSAGGMGFSRPGHEPGPGYLAGTFPGGITSVDGVPTTATIRVHYRPAEGAVGDGALVATLQSAPDGSWRVDGLDPNLKFDVICRKEGFNDMILSGVSPVPY